MTTHNNLRAVGVCEAVCAVTLKRFRASIASNEELFTCRSTPLCFLLNESEIWFQRGYEPPEGPKSGDTGATLTLLGNFFFPFFQVNSQTLYLRSALCCHLPSVSLSWKNF